MKPKKRSNLAMAGGLAIAVGCFLTMLLIQVSVPTPSARTEAEKQRRRTEERIADIVVKEYVKHYRDDRASLSDIVASASVDDVIDAMLGAKSPLNPHGMHFLSSKTDLSNAEAKEHLLVRLREELRKE